MPAATPPHPATLALLSLMLAAPAGAGDGVVVGHDASGRLKARVDAPSFEIPFSVFPGVPGWATGEIGFESLDFDDPADDLYVTDTAADVEIVLLAFDPGCRFWSPSQPMSAGQTIHFGHWFFDYHPIWQIEDGPAGAPFTLRFFVRDLSGLYADSAPFEVTITGAYCLADYDTNGFVNGDDFDAFAADFDAGNPAADVNKDGFTNGDDFDDFTRHFDAGC